MEKQHSPNEIFEQVNALKKTQRQLLWYAIPTLFSVIALGGVWVGNISSQQDRNTETLKELTFTVDQVSSAVISRQQLNDILKPIQDSQQRTAEDIAEIKEILRSL